MLADETERLAAHNSLKRLVKDSKASQVIAELAPATGRREKVAEIIGNCRANLRRMR